MTLTVTSDKDRVILAFPRRRDLQLTPDAARKTASAMLESASECEAWVKGGGGRTIVTGATRGALVQSWDGMVNVRLDSTTNLESIPYLAARRLAQEILAKVVEAENRMTILFPNMRLAETLK